VGPRLLALPVLAALGLGGVARPAVAADITGTNGPDPLHGTSHADTVDARGGDDNLQGEAGDDLLSGGGPDYLVGGAGDDRVYLSADDEVDVIDCGPGEGVVTYFYRIDAVDELLSCETVNITEDPEG
jgi:Ca2+-binding RTX toxin-like protein